MRYLTIILFASLLFAACSTTKDIETASLTQDPCREETQITDANVFTGETADNLQVYQQGDLIFASMDVRTYCNARITFNVIKNDMQLRLMLNRAGASNDQCLCITNVTTSLKNIDAGTYSVIVMNSTGNQILAESSFTAQ